MPRDELAEDHGLDPELPTWVERSVAPAVREWLNTAKHQGGFLILAGNSSVGKTRLLYQVAIEALSDWHVLCPVLGDGGRVNQFAAEASDIAEGVVVWLDEIYRFLPGPGLSTGSTPVKLNAIGALLDSNRPIVILASLWPSHYSTLTALKTGDSGIAEHLYPEAANILRMGTLITVESFSKDEESAARALSGNDPRLATAVDDRDFGVTEVLAGAPALVRRYEMADRLHKALLLAAVDAQRLGVRPPLSAKLLKAAARGYLSTPEPSSEWVAPALDDLSRRQGPMDRSTAPLLAIYDAMRHRIAGYEVADYLLHRATRERRTCVPATATWKALIKHTRSPEDLDRLGDSAARRGEEDLAVAALTKAVKHGHGPSAARLAVLLSKRGDVDRLRDLAGTGNSMAIERLDELLADRGSLDELRARIAAGDGRAAFELARVLGENSDLRELDRIADRNPWAAYYAAQARAERGDLDSLRVLADGGDLGAREHLGFLLAKQGNEQELEARAFAGDKEAAGWLQEFRADRADLDELREMARSGSGSAQYRLAARLAKEGDLSQLRAMTEEGNVWASWILVKALVRGGALDEISSLAEKRVLGIEYAIADVLAVNGDLAPMRELADSGDASAGYRLVELLVQRNDLDSLRQEVRAGTSGAVDALRKMRDADA